MELRTDHLVELREEREWSNAQLARVAGINQSFCSQLERKVRNPSQETVLKLADALGVDPQELVA